MSNLNASVVSRLGNLALVPFVVGAIVICATGGSTQALAAKVTSAYGAVVISFLGGIHWGLGFREPQPSARLFLWGVVPSLVAWMALLFSSPTALLLNAGMLSLCYLIDRGVYPLHGSAHWLPLRFRLTVIAVPSCLVGAAGAW